jgi:hypothetical protein
MPFLFTTLLLITTVLIGVHYYLEKKRQHWQLLDPFNAFLAVFFIIYVLEPLGFYKPLHTSYGDPILYRTQLSIIWALPWLLLGYHLKVSQRIGLKFPNMPAKLRPDLLQVAGLVMICLGIFGYAYSANSAGGLTAWLAVGRGGTDYEATTGYGVVLETFLPVGVILLLLRVEMNPTLLPTRLVIWGLAVLQWLWFVYLGSRGRTILFLLSLVAIFYLPRRKAPSLWLACLVAIPLFLLAAFQAQYRDRFTNLSLHLDQLTWSEVKTKILPASLGGDIGQDNGRSLGDLEYNCTTAVVDCVPTYVPYNYGGTLLELLTHGIPRALWPNKRYPLYEYQTPIMETRDLSRNWNMTNTSAFLRGPAFTYVGYWYHAGGYVALALAGLFTGAMLRWVRTYLDRDPNNQGNLILYLMLLPIGFQDAASTPFYWLFSLPLSLIPVIIFMFWARDREAADSSAPQPALTSG